MWCSIATLLRSTCVEQRSTQHLYGLIALCIATICTTHQLVKLSNADSILRKSTWSSDLRLYRANVCTGCSASYLYYLYHRNTPDVSSPFSNLGPAGQVTKGDCHTWNSQDSKVDITIKMRMRHASQLCASCSKLGIGFYSRLQDKTNGPLCSAHSHINF